jgi:hypothetical protein
MTALDTVSATSTEKGTDEVEDGRQGHRHLGFSAPVEMEAAMALAVSRRS